MSTFGKYTMGSCLSAVESVVLHGPLLDIAEQAQFAVLSVRRAHALLRSTASSRNLPQPATAVRPGQAAWLAQDAACASTYSMARRLTCSTLQASRLWESRGSGHRRGGAGACWEATSSRAQSLLLCLCKLAKQAPAHLAASPAFFS